jgi:hypothetical protein
MIIVRYHEPKVVARPASKPNVPEPEPAETNGADADDTGGVRCSQLDELV